MATTHLPKRSMRNKPTGDIADFSREVKLTYSVMLTSKAFNDWVNTAVHKLARQGKNFELTGTVDGVSITVRGRRVTG